MSASYFSSLSTDSPPTPLKTLVLFFDGTGNCSETGVTNVSRLYAALKRDILDKQLLYYQPGIGTYISPTLLWAHTFRKLSKVVDTCFGWFLGDHVLKGYRFLMQNYRPGDRICFFGFSRGAYTAQVLAGMLQRVGLLPLGNEEQVGFAWKRYLDDSDRGIKLAETFKQTFALEVEVSFVGVWDTVASVGMFGHNLGFTYFNPGIKNFRHAVALDERRTKFRPFQRHHLDDDVNDQTKSKTGPLEMGGKLSSDQERSRREDIEKFEGAYREVWFVGGHGDVSGGHPLANIPLGWMVKEAILVDVGLQFRAGAFDARPSVYAAIGKEARLRAGMEVEESLLAMPKDVPENLIPTLGKDCLPDMTPDKQIDDLYADWTTSPTNLGDDLQEEAASRAVTATMEYTQALIQDACEDIHDQLKAVPAWWLLEWLPLWERRVHHRKGSIARRIRLGRGRGRVIRKSECLIHSSVRVRQLLRGYEAKATWNGDPRFVE